MSFFKKALSIFVEIEETPSTTSNTTASPNARQPPPVNTIPSVSTPTPAIQQADLSKFVQHFEQLFEKANLPGPDYYEFWKMMDTLEVHIPDENTRIQAVFATLGLQGLNKVSLIDTASQYKNVVMQDKTNFEAVVQQKSASEIAARRNNIQNIETEAANKQKMIAQLQVEIETATVQLAQLQQEITEEETKIYNSKQGYMTACNAMVSKIDQDIKRFQQVLTS